jgi:hypothetical protein
MAATRKLQSWIAQNGGAKDNFSKTFYVAEITGEHDKYGLARDFISTKIDSSYSGSTGTKAVDVEDLTVGACYEVRGDSHGNKHQRFVRLDDIEHTDDGVVLETTRLNGEDAVLDELGNGATRKKELRASIQDDLSDLDVDDLEAVRDAVDDVLDDADGDGDD